jgi:haloalkane dehalogenase
VHLSSAVLPLVALLGCAPTVDEGGPPLPDDTDVGDTDVGDTDAGDTDTADTDTADTDTADTDEPGSECPANASGTMDVLRTPDERFDDLPGFPFQPRYICVDDPTGEPGNRRIRVHYTVSGPDDAPTLLMLHGNPSWSYLFRRLVPRLNDAGYRTVAVDLVGHGRSDKPADEADYTYDRQLEWIRQAIEGIDDAVGLRPVVLFGHDYGHPLGARLIAEHRPDLFDGFINGNAGLNRGLSGLSPRHEQWRDFVRSAPVVPVGALICENAARTEAGVPPCPEAVQAAYMAPTPDRAYQASIRAFPEFVPEDPTWPEARSNQVAWDHLTSAFDRPYMVIWEDVDLPDARRNRRAEYIAEVPGAFGREQPQLRTGHYAPEDDPEGVAAASVRFLDDIYAPRPFTEVLRTDFSSSLSGVSCTDPGCTYDDASGTVRLDGGEGPGLVQIAPMDLTTAAELKVAFRYLPWQTDPGDEVRVDLWDGSGWTPVLALQGGGAPDEGDFFHGSTDYGYVRLGADEAAFSADARIRLRMVTDAEDAVVIIKELGVYVSSR